MIWLYRKTVGRLIGDLRSLEEDPGNLLLLLGLQERLRATIIRGEKRIKTLKVRIGADKRLLRARRLPRGDARALKARIKRQYDALENYQAFLLALRAIGDAIAYCYFHCHDLRTLSVRENPGFISGKKGARLELKSLRMTIRQGSAAVLCDITNTLRYGDIAVPTGEAPLIIEVKSGHAVDPNSPQLQKLKKVAEYLHTDKSDEVYGLQGQFRRIELPFFFSYRIRDLNELISAAYENQARFSVTNVEDGLWYAAMLPSDQTFQERFDEHLGPVVKQCTKALAFYLNVHKTGWAAFRPYTLSIRNAEHLMDFMQGSLGLFVLLDAALLEKALQAHGYEVGIDLSNERVLTLRSEALKRRGLEGLQLGWHFFYRLPLEFVSLESFARVTDAYVNTLLADPEIVAGLGGDALQPPTPK